MREVHSRRGVMRKNEAKKIRIVVLCAVCYINLVACSYEKSADIYESENKYWTEEDVKDNTVETEIIREYSLKRNADGVEKAEYLLEKYFVGKGVFQSEYIRETDALVAGLLMKTIEQQGRISEDIRQYFSEWAMEQLQEADWEQLNESWMADLYLYDSYYTITWLFGNIGYDCNYFFYPDNGTQAVNMRLLIDPCGLIRKIDVDICGLSEESGVFDAQDLFREEYQERIIEEGLVYQGKYLLNSLDTEEIYDQNGSNLFASGDLALSGEKLGGVLITLLERCGINADEYRELFEDENTFLRFQDLSWNQLETDWVANRYYDCYYIDTMEETGGVDFLYNIYPDYEKMDTDFASAVILRCRVDINNGKLSDANIETCPMTVEEYHEAKDWMGQRVTLIDKGNISGYGTVPLPIPGEQGRENTPKDLSADNLGKKLLADLNSKVLENGEINELLAEKQTAWFIDIAGRIEEELKTGWQIREEYNCYYYVHSQQVKHVHYRYYFYFDKQGLESQKVLVLDLWISDEGIETMKEHWFMIDMDATQQTKQLAFGKPSADISAFLTFDWTTDDVLMSHSISPEDSARGWGFSLSDVDFDGSLEMLVSFTANHCGGNSLYIYKQYGNQVHSLADTYATFKEDIAVDIENYGIISPYLDVGLLDVYVNADGEYRYLSLDYSLFGGDERGGMGNLVLYTTSLSNACEPQRLVEFSYSCPDEERAIYFLGDKVYELGRLRDLLAEYMAGYTKLELEFKTSEVSFPRDMVDMDENEKRQWLENLYESLKGYGIGAVHWSDKERSFCMRTIY